MRVSEIMTGGVECISPHATLQEVAKKMRDLDVGALPVCGDRDRLVGVITDRDIAVRAVADGCDPKSAHIEDFMTRKVIYCFDDQNVAEAAEIMEENQIRRLVVLNRNKRLVGIVALADLAIETADLQLAGEALERVSEPPASRR